MAGKIPIGNTRKTQAGREPARRGGRAATAPAAAPSLAPAFAPSFEPASGPARSPALASPPGSALAPALARATAPATTPVAYRIGGGRLNRKWRDPLPAISFLKGTDLWSAYQRLAALEWDLRQIQPRLEITPLKLANQILVVTAGSPSVAARLRQFEPSLIAGLRARGWLVGRIRFRPIAVHDAPPPPPRRIKEPVSGAVLRELETLDATGMNDELKAALSMFVRRQRSYL